MRWLRSVSSKRRWRLTDAPLRPPTARTWKWRSPWRASNACTVMPPRDACAWAGFSKHTASSARDCPHGNWSPPVTPPGILPARIRRFTPPRCGSTSRRSGETRRIPRPTSPSAICCLTATTTKKRCRPIARPWSWTPSSRRRCSALPAASTSTIPTGRSMRRFSPSRRGRLTSPRWFCWHACIWSWRITQKPRDSSNVLLPSTRARPKRSPLPPRWRSCVEI